MKDDLDIIFWRLIFIGVLVGWGLVGLAVWLV
jgi:hypothetical protein